MSKKTTSKKEVKPRRTVSKRGVRPDARELAKEENGLIAQGNQWQATERQLMWLDLYMNPKNKNTYANPYESALQAGFSPSYAKAIMSPNTALKWVQSARQIMRTMNTEHIRSNLEDIALDKYEKTGDRIKALQMLGVDQGMFVQKNITAHIGLEEALEALE